MPAPTMTLSTSGADPKLTTKQILEAEVTRIAGILFDQANPEDAASAAASAAQALSHAAAADVSEAAAAASAAAALVFQTTALAAANAAGPTVIYATKALADAGLAGLAANTVIEVGIDESRYGRRTRYRKTGGVYVFELDLSPVVNAAAFGVLPTATALENTAGMSAAVDAMVALGGGIIEIPPATVAYNFAQQIWADAGSRRGCIRLNANVGLHVPAGTEIKMGSTQISGTTGADVIILNGADTSVTGAGLINGNSVGQSGWTGGYTQNGPAGVYIRAGALCHRARVGSGEVGYLRIENCFGNPVNGGGVSAASRADDISIVGVRSDKVGEGPQLEFCNRPEMRRIVSLNTTATMVGDGAELAACINATVSDIHSRDSPTSGFDLFGCQRVDMSNVSAYNCNIDIHDFSPVDPCTDVDARGLYVEYTSGGGGTPGITVTSTHATKAPKNISVQGRVFTSASLAYGILINQAQAVATYGGGPYTIDLDIEGVATAGVAIERAPRLRGRAIVRNSARGLNVEATGFPTTDNVEWDLEINVRNSSVVDLAVNGTSPSGAIKGIFDTGQAGADLAVIGRFPSVLTTASDTFVTFGQALVKETGSLVARIGVRPDGTELRILFVNGGDLGVYANSGTNKGITTTTGSAVTFAAGRFATLVFDATSDKWLQV
jgi:hypothetical protein